MLPTLFFKRQNNTAVLLCGNSKPIYRWLFLLALLPLFLTGCSGAKKTASSAELGKNDLADLNLRGPVRSMFVEVAADIGSDSTRGNKRGPREYREFDVEGHLLYLVEFGGTVEDTTAVTRHYYDSLGLRQRTISGTWVGRNRWQWSREDFTYDSTGTLRWSARYFDTARGAPYIAFCYSRTRVDEKDCLEYWQNVKTLKVVYFNEQDLPLGEQWLGRGESNGVIRYQIDTVAGEEGMYVRFQLPPESIDTTARRYVANLYNQDGRLVEQWSYAQENASTAKYSDADLREIKVFDNAGRLETWTFFGVSEREPVIQNRLQYDDLGNLQEKVRVNYSSREAYTKGKKNRIVVEEQFEYTQIDHLNNWQRAVTVSGRDGKAKGVIHRTFEYWE